MSVCRAANCGRCQPLRPPATSRSLDQQRQRAGDQGPKRHQAVPGYRHTPAALTRYCRVRSGLSARYYLPLTDVRMDLLRSSDTQTHCPYKGTAADIVWIYRTPLPESQKVAGLACFYNETVDIYLDGELQERPRTHFS